jgi:hypothetical protein
MKRSVFGVICLLTLWTASAHAARIFGDIKLDGKPLPEGVLVTLQRAAKPDANGKPMAGPIDSTTTDKVGSYKFTVKEEGKCTLTVLYEKKPVSIEVFSYKEPTRYDLLLEKKEGKFTLRRK